MRNISLIVIHCSASRPSMDVGAADIDKWHKARGFRMIGYHYVIRRNGQVEKGRDDAMIGAHVEGHNANSIGVCWVGGISDDKFAAEDNRTDAQKATLATLVQNLHARYPAAMICGHRDIAGVHKDCPSFDVKTWLREIKLEQCFGVPNQ